MYEYVVSVPCPAVNATGGATGKTVIEVPEGVKLEKGFVYADSVNVAGTPTLTFDVQKGAAGSEASMLVAAASGHATNDNQEIDLTPLKTTGANVAANGRVVCTYTATGSSAGAVSGVVFTLCFNRPLNPA